MWNNARLSIHLHCFYGRQMRVLNCNGQLVWFKSRVDDRALPWHLVGMIMSSFNPKLPMFPKIHFLLICLQLYGLRMNLEWISNCHIFNQKLKSEWLRRKKIPGLILFYFIFYIYLSLFAYHSVFLSIPVFTNMCIYILTCPSHSLYIEITWSSIMF